MSAAFKMAATISITAFLCSLILHSGILVPTLALLPF